MLTVHPHFVKGSVVLVQRVRYLFKVLFVELEKRQALEEGRNLEVFCSFFFFFCNLDSKYW